MNKLLITIALSAGIAIPAIANLTVEDYCDITTATPKGVKEIRPLSDGVSYAAVSDDQRSIEIFSYKTGKKTGILFSLDDVKGDVKITDFDGYALSDNEKKILLWNDVEKIYRHSFTATYYVYDVMRSTMSKVSEEGKQRCATLSHDGRCVAYVRDNNIFISNLDYKTDRAITTDGEINKVIYGAPDWGYEEEFGVTNTICWSGDDNYLVYMRFDESKVPTYSFDAYRGYCDNDPLGDPYPATYNYKYPLAGYPNSVVGVYSYNMNNRVANPLQLPLTETDYIPDLRFDGEGKNVMAMVLNRDQNNLSLYIAEPSSTICTKILTEKSNAWLAPNTYQMVKYGKTSFVIGSDRSGWTHLYEYNYNGRLLRQLTNGEFNVTNYYGYNTQSRKHYLQTTSLGAINRNVAEVDANGKLTLLHNTEGWESASFSQNMEYYLRTYSSSSTPTQYTIWTTKGNKITDVELNEEYATKYANAPKMEFLKVKNDAGEEMNAYIIRPADFDASKKYPLMMYQYNGPDSQEVCNRWRMEGIFYIASKGYIVAAVDGRGTGFRSRQWAHSVYKDLGNLETKDQIAGANYFRSLSYVDSEKASCFGWSYGGYMTLMELTSPDSPFKCGVSMAPVTDWRWYDSIYTERYMLTPEQNKKGYDTASTINRAADLKGNLLIMSGTSDDNVHFYNTLKFTSKLTSEGLLFDMMAYTAFEHSLRMCNARTQLFKKIGQFLDNNLK